MNHSGSHIAMSRLGKSKPRGITPTTTCAVPLSVSVVPRMSGRPPNTERHVPSLRTTGRVAPLVSSAATNVRPIAAVTPRVSKRLFVA